MWKIVVLAKVSVVYIYIYIDYLPFAQYIYIYIYIYLPMQVHQKHVALTRKKELVDIPIFEQHKYKCTPPTKAW